MQTQVNTTGALGHETSFSAQCFASDAWTQWVSFVAGQHVRLQQSSSLLHAGPGPSGNSSTLAVGAAVSGTISPPVSETFGFGGALEETVDDATVTDGTGATVPPATAGAHAASHTSAEALTTPPSPRAAVPVARR